MSTAPLVFGNGFEGLALVPVIEVEGVGRGSFRGASDALEDVGENTERAGDAIIFLPCLLPCPGVSPSVARRRLDWLWHHGRPVHGRQAQNSVEETQFNFCNFSSLSKHTPSPARCTMTMNADGSLAAYTQRLAEEAREVAHTTLLMEQGQSLNTWAYTLGS